jgi:hypothetical protein
MSSIMQSKPKAKVILNDFTEKEFDSLIEDAVVFEEGKVYMLKDGSILKLFGKKSLISSSTLLPYSLRFAQNAQRLHKRGIPTINILQVIRFKHLNATAVHYTPIPGDTLRSFAHNAEFISEDLIHRFATFVARLHDQGIAFRSFHLANVIVNDTHEMGLIDISDLKIRNRPLTFKERFRNFDRIYRYADDIEILRTPGDTYFIDSYLKATEAVGADAWRNQLQTQQDDLVLTRHRTTD